MTRDTVRKIEENIQRAKQIVELDKALDRLESNKDFKTVVIDGYIHAEAVRLVHLKSDPNMQTPERQASIMTSIDAIGGLLQYFRTISHNAAIAVKAIEADEAERDELLAEELDQ